VCAFGVAKPRADTTVALIGDSHAGHWKAAMDVVARRKNWYGLNIGHASCPLSTATRPIDEPNRSHCIEWKKRVFKWFERHPEVSVVFVSQLSGGTGVVPQNGKSAYETAVSGYIAAWKKLPPTVKHVIVIRDTPKVRGNTDACVQTAMNAGRRAGPACAVSVSRAIDPRSRRGGRQAHARRPGLVVTLNTSSATSSAATRWSAAS
jgi:hypothetical protein